MNTAYRQANLNRSFGLLLETKLGSYAGRIFYNDIQADPTGLDSRTTALDYWVNLRFVVGGVGLKQATIFQIDCYSNASTPFDATYQDRFGNLATRVADDVIGAFSTADLGTRISDFTDPDNPVLTAEWLLIRNSAGQQGWPDGRRQLRVDRGLVVEVLTYHVWHHQDLHPSVQIYF